MPMDPDCVHLEQLVESLVRAGNEVVDGGFRHTQGDPACGLRDPLHPAVVEASAAHDDQLVFHRDLDEVSCLHCRTTVYGGAATARYQSAHRDAMRARRWWRRWRKES